MFSNQSRSLIILCLSSDYNDPGGQQLLPPGTTDPCEGVRPLWAQPFPRTAFYCHVAFSQGTRTACAPCRRAYRGVGGKWHLGGRVSSPGLGTHWCLFIEPFSPPSSRLQLGALGLPEVGAPLVRAGLGGSLTASCRCCLGPAC